jgi:hypothetical protein
MTSVRIRGVLLHLNRNQANLSLRINKMAYFKLVFYSHYASPNGPVSWLVSTVVGRGGGGEMTEPLRIIGVPPEFRT